MSVPLKIAALLVVGSLVTGCGFGPSEAKGSGKVVYKGTPITEGSINFLAKDKGIGAMTKLDSAGSFALPDGLTPGQYMVSVTPPTPTPPPPGTPSVKATSLIPLKARDPVSSGVTVSLQSGSNDLLVELKD